MGNPVSPPAPPSPRVLLIKKTWAAPSPLPATATTKLEEKERVLAPVIKSNVFRAPTRSSIRSGGKIDSWLPELQESVTPISTTSALPLIGGTLLTRVGPKFSSPTKKVLETISTPLDAIKDVAQTRSRAQDFSNLLPPHYRGNFYHYFFTSPPAYLLTRSLPHFPSLISSILRTSPPFLPN